MITLSDFALLLEGVLEDVGQNLREREAGASGSGTVSELEMIQNELAALALSLKGGEPLPPRSHRYLESARYVLENWPPKEKLGERVCMVDYLYRHDLE